jgi:DNA-binding response OmpR family regulator
MENERAGIEVVRAAREAEYDPAVAMLTAFPIPGEEWESAGADQMLVKPMNTNDLLLQIEALLVTHEDKKQKAKPGAQPDYAAAAAQKTSAGRRKAAASD